MKKRSFVARMAWVPASAAVLFAVPLTAHAWTTDVPEPGTMALLALGLGSIGVIRLARRRK